MSIRGIGHPKDSVLSSNVTKRSRNHISTLYPYNLNIRNSKVKTQKKRET